MESESSSTSDDASSFQQLQCTKDKVGKKKNNDVLSLKKRTQIRKQRLHEDDLKRMVNESDTDESDNNQQSEGGPNCSSDNSPVVKLKKNRKIANKEVKQKISNKKSIGFSLYSNDEMECKKTSQSNIGVENGSKIKTRHIISDTDGSNSSEIETKKKNTNLHINPRKRYDLTKTRENSGDQDVSSKKQNKNSSQEDDKSVSPCSDEADKRINSKETSSITDESEFVLEIEPDDGISSEDGPSLSEVKKNRKETESETNVMNNIRDELEVNDEQSIEKKETMNRNVLNMCVSKLGKNLKEKKTNTQLTNPNNTSDSDTNPKIDDHFNEQDQYAKLSSSNSDDDVLLKTEPKKKILSRKSMSSKSSSDKIQKIIKRPSSSSSDEDVPLIKKLAGLNKINKSEKSTPLDSRSNTTQRNDNRSDNEDESEEESLSSSDRDVLLRNKKTDKDRPQKTQPSKSKSNSERRMKKLKKYLRECGYRMKNYETFFQDCKSEAAKIRKLLAKLEELGIKGQPTLEKCKKIRLKLEKKKEVEELDIGNIIESQGRSLRCTTASWGKRPSEETSALQVSRFKRLKGFIESDSD
ncbi:hypothetical protein QYM36_011972 [Artemia franciscana]|uniref:HIRA-interacting protein 3 n=1 Tax=Artemia franciscana TaxID=6661 RepID=A0AA88L787_ARTSF|nr:hypothetical protein QYM36_011972 [Artemia franciscana]KAK2710624.1 hypothetical protein QYM36_011972 [Artemia franciscana]KAK2710625.1 hypothetical protein QYM36_011972 [Artemia franciscana]KAK2710626.1 hypothetical protein QYM36_011972 [Artemia franciscana]KAK2710627.1 hypothetical protein QYM36_011972 [Artemia franciscana]